jgi:hypothetical protein
MALGKALVTQTNNAGGAITAVERKILFIGVGGASALADQLHAINQQSDFETLLGAEDSPLKTNVMATALNAGPNFTAYVIPLKAAAGVYTWDTALEFALDQPNDLDVEMIALTDHMASVNDVDLYQAACVSAINVFAKYITIHAAVAGNDGSSSWADYLAATKALQASKVAPRVHLVPQLHGNNLGVVVGRLANDAFSLGDSPMRVRSGSVTGLGVAPVDDSGLALTMAHLGDLADNRFSVPQTYTGFDGTYWADHMSLDAEGGDFQVYENLRVLDYITRRVRLKVIYKIADKSLNSSDESISFHEGYFMQPIFDAAKASSINGEPIPGLVQPPKKGDIVITWQNANEVDVYMMAAPGNSPKKLTAHLSLDLNRLG